MAILTSKPSWSNWNYFLAIESDLANTSRYVEFREDNFSTYSIEFVHLLLAASSEVDVVAKLLCKKIDKAKEPRSIGAYQDIIVSRFQKLPTFQAQVPKHELTLKPWEQWREKRTSPRWWRSYNKVKHQRDAKFKDANLKNVLNAFAGLFCLLNYYYGTHSIRAAAPKLFDTEVSDRSGGVLFFKLPDNVQWLGKGIEDNGGVTPESRLPL